MLLANSEPHPPAPSPLAVQGTTVLIKGKRVNKKEFIGHIWK
jgi:hypothetical protein